MLLALLSELGTDCIMPKGLLGQRKGRESYAGHFQPVRWLGHLAMANDLCWLVYIDVN